MQYNAHSFAVAHSNLMLNHEFKLDCGAASAWVAEHALFPLLTGGAMQSPDPLLLDFTMNAQVIQDPLYLRAQPWRSSPLIPLPCFHHERVSYQGSTVLACPALL
jgi:hypothetical protein